MDEAEFDKFALEYDEMHRQNIRVSGEGPEYFAEYKIRDIRQDFEARQLDAEPTNILDFGGGIGASAPYFSSYFPHSDITLADVSERSLALAEQRNVPRCSTLLFDGATLPLDENSQDIALAACVFHHIPADQHAHLFKEILRVLRPGGRLFVFEHNPWNPLTVRAVNTCPFDENAVLINALTLRRRVEQGGFGASDIDVKFRIFFPAMLKSLRPFEAWLTKLPIGAQYALRAEK